MSSAAPRRRRTYPAKRAARSTGRSTEVPRSRVSSVRRAALGALLVVLTQGRPAAGQAEPEPGARAEGAPQGGRAVGPSPLPAFDVTAVARGSLRLPPRDLGPALGFGFALSAELRYLSVQPWLALGAQLDLGHLRHARDVEGTRTGPDGQEQTFPGFRILADNQFCLLQTLGAARPVLGHPARAWLGLGGGLALGDFQSDERTLRPGSATALRAVTRAALGLEIDLTDGEPGGAFLAVRADLTHPLRATRFASRSPDGAAGPPVRLFGDTLTLGMAIGSRFQ